MAYDFLYNMENQLTINEMCCHFIDWMVYSYPCYWDEHLNWYKGHFWPQYCQIQDLLSKEDLIQPEFPKKNKSALIRIAL